jgi:SDR family mycofactocin-dependent oxidoreductase
VADPRVAIVTGAGRGIGAATVRRLAAEGWNVVAVDRCADDPALPYALATREELDAVVASCPRAVAFVADVRDADAMEEAVALAVSRFGGLDAALAVAGAIAGGAPLWAMPWPRVEAMLDINLGGAIGLARAAIPALLERPSPRSGRFVAVASAAATRGMPGLAAYSAAKAGVTGLVRGLAADLRGTGVTANAVSPGSTATPVLDESARLYHLASADEFAPQHTLERLLRADEIANVLAWLCGPEASALTGAVVAADGGLSL